MKKFTNFLIHWRWVISLSFLVFSFFMVSSEILSAAILRIFSGPPDLGTLSIAPLIFLRQLSYSLTRQCAELERSKKFRKKNKIVFRNCFHMKLTVLSKFFRKWFSRLHPEKCNYINRATLLFINLLKQILRNWACAHLRPLLHLVDRKILAREGHYTKRLKLSVRIGAWVCRDQCTPWIIQKNIIFT